MAEGRSQGALGLSGVSSMTAHPKPAIFVPKTGDERIFAVSPAGYQVHAMHGPERHWPQTNCYADLWIEILHRLGTEPAAAFGFTVAQDFEGDQFTFFKPPLDDLEALFGLRVTELALYDDLIGHLRQQIARHRLVLIELDSFYMPDTRGVSYRETHGKTTIGINRLDPVAREVDYFHNDGFFHASGEDFDGLFRLLPGQMREDTLFPYAEMVKLPTAPTEASELKATAVRLLAHHLARVPVENPVAAYRAVASAQAEVLAERAPHAFHHYAFNTLRQLGANFELLASHLGWIGGDFAAPEAAALRLAEGSKIAQFQLARALRQRRFDRFDGALEPLVADYDAVIASLRRALSR
ncbi:MAG: serine--tRNA ligase [Rhizobiales bacterium PAR1]|nr:MAG: serine--tRNA ligase [Rhizobiales bacterium PAR1]